MCTADSNFLPTATQSTQIAKYSQYKSIPYDGAFHTDESFSLQKIQTFSVNLQVYYNKILIYKSNFYL